MGADFTKIAGIVVGSALFALTSSPAQAGTRVVAPTDAGESFALSISGYITPKCAVTTAQDSSAHFMDLLDQANGRANISSTLSLPFAMECNSPFEATLSSKNGGLDHDGPVEPSFARSVDYAAVLDMGAINHGVTLSCDSAAMRAAEAREEGSRCHAKSDDQISGAAGKGYIRLKVIGGSQPLQSGTYSDEIVIKISPRVSG